MVQNRRSVDAGIVMPNCGMFRSTHPKLPPIVRPDVGKAKAAQKVEGDATGQSLGRLTNQVSGSTAQDQVTLRLFLIHEISEQRKQFRSTLDLVDDDQS